jgi:nucleoside-diphosphate-sugar epimerase
VLNVAVEGTLNVLKVCSATKVQKVVVVSSTASVMYDPCWPQYRLKDMLVRRRVLQGEWGQ